MPNLEIVSVPEFEGCTTIGFRCAGHVDKAAFIAALREQHHYSAKPGDVVHEYWHYVPVPALGSGYYITRGAPGRGWQAVTRIDRAKCKDLIALPEVAHV